MYIVQDRLGLLADENGESLGAVNCGHLYISIFLREKELKMDKIFNTLASPLQMSKGKRIGL